MKATKKQIVTLHLNEKKSKESQTRSTSWYWKRKPTWRKDLIKYNSHPWIMLSFNWLVIIWREGVRLKLDVQGQGGGRILDLDGQRGWVVLKIGHFHGRHMCIIPKVFPYHILSYVSSLNWNANLFVGRIVFRQTPKHHL